MNNLVEMKAKAFELIRDIEFIGGQLQQLQQAIFQEEQKLAAEKEKENVNTQQTDRVEQ